jgi:hypothetical protein
MESVFGTQLNSSKMFHWMKSISDMTQPPQYITSPLMDSHSSGASDLFGRYMV